MKKKLIIEVRANERAMRDGSPHVPWLPEELGEDAARCRAAGAAIYHYHPRHADGQQTADIAVYEASVSTIRARSDVLVHPTLIASGSPMERLAAHLALARSAALRPDMAPLDMGTTNMDIWSEGALRHERTYENTVTGLAEMAGALTAHGIHPCLVAWNIPFLRRIGAMLANGSLAQPCYVHLLLSGDRFLAAHPATIAGLEAYFPFMPEATFEWTVLANGATLEHLLPFVIERGGHVSIGLGDHPYPALGTPRNADLVAHVAALAAAMGREIATPEETKSMLGMA